MSWQNMLSVTMSLLLIILSGAVFVWTSGMTPGAELFPRIMAGGLALFGIVELALMFMKIRKNSNTSDTNQAVDISVVKKSIVYMGAFFVLVVLFFVSLPYVGFAVTSTIFMFVSMLLIGGKEAIRKWPVALLVPVMLILVFKYGLEVRLPPMSFF